MTGRLLTALGVVAANLAILAVDLLPGWVGFTAAVASIAVLLRVPARGTARPRPVVIALAAASALVITSLIDSGLVDPLRLRA